MPSGLDGIPWGGFGNWFFGGQPRPAGCFGAYGHGRGCVIEGEIAVRSRPTFSYQRPCHRPRSTQEPLYGKYAVRPTDRSIGRRKAHRIEGRYSFVDYFCLAANHSSASAESLRCSPFLISVSSDRSQGCGGEGQAERIRRIGGLWPSPGFVVSTGRNGRAL